MKPVIIIAIAFVLLIPVGTNVVFAQSDNLTVKHWFISGLDSCSTRNEKSLNFYETLTSQYLSKYDIHGVQTPGKCVTLKDVQNNMNTFSDTLLQFDLPIIILDSLTGIEHTLKTNAFGHYIWQGNEQVIIFSSLSPFIESDTGAWTLSHELSHFALHHKNYPMTIVRDWVHSTESQARTCLKSDDYSINNCPELWTTVKAPSGKNIKMMVIYEDTEPASSSSNEYQPSPKTPIPTTPNTTSDYDGDGIPDYRDDCMYMKETYNGFEDEDGCWDLIPLKPLKSPSSFEPSSTDDGLFSTYDEQITASRSEFSSESTQPIITEKIYPTIDFTLIELDKSITITEGVEIEGKLYYISPKGHEIGIPNARVQLKSYDKFSVIETLYTDYAGSFKWKASRNTENYDEKTGISSWDLYLNFEGNEQYNLNSKVIGPVTIQNPNIDSSSKVTKSEISENKESQFCFLFWCW